MAYNSYTQSFYDSTGAFLEGELEVVEQTLHLPLNVVTFHLDLLPRKDVTIADDWASWTNSSYASGGGLSATGKSWAAKRANAIPAVELDIKKTIQELPVWSKSVDWTIIEIEQSQKLGRPVDIQKVTALQTLWNQDIDNQAYLGDAELGVYGLANSPAITNHSNAVTGGWASASASQILADIRELEESVYQTSGYAAAPTKLLVPAQLFAYITQPLVIGGVPVAMSIKQYLAENSLCNSINGFPLDIQPRKWLGTSITAPNALSSNTMVAYTPNYDFVRFPWTPLQHTPIEYRDIRMLTTYFGRIGAPEIVYPSSIGTRANL